MKKVCIIILFVLMISFVFCNYSYADIEGLGDLSQYKGVIGNPTKFTTKAKNIAGVIEVVGVVVSVVVLLVIGIKYMLGSVEERADYKKTLIPYIVGAIFVFCMSIIPQLIFNFMQNF